MYLCYWFVGKREECQFNDGYIYMYFTNRERILLHIHVNYIYIYILLNDRISLFYRDEIILLF